MSYAITKMPSILIQTTVRTEENTAHNRTTREDGMWLPERKGN